MGQDCSKLPEGLSHQQAVLRATVLSSCLRSSPPPRLFFYTFLGCQAWATLLLIWAAALDPQPSAVCVTLSHHSCLSHGLSRPPCACARTCPASLVLPASEHQLPSCYWGCVVGLFLWILLSSCPYLPRSPNSPNSPETGFLCWF